MKKPSDEDANKCYEIRKRSKTIDNYYNIEEIKFCEKMLKEYPEWYASLDEKLFNDTRPFGSLKTYKKSNK